MLTELTLPSYVVTFQIFVMHLCHNIPQPGMVFPHPHIHVSKSTIPSRSHISVTSSKKPYLILLAVSHLFLLRTHAELFLGLSNDKYNVLPVLVIFIYELVALLESKFIELRH